MVKAITVYTAIIPLDFVYTKYGKAPDDDLIEIWTGDMAASFGLTLIVAKFNPLVPQVTFYFTEELPAQLCDTAFRNVARKLKP